MTNDERTEIDRLINIFLTGLGSISKDAGWEGDSLLSRVIQFAGCPPMSSGYDKSNDSMINAIRRLHRSNPDFPRIQSAVNAGLKFNYDKTIALLAKHYYQGLSDIQDRAYTDQMRGMKVGQSHQVFRHNVNRSYEVIQGELDRVDIYLAYHYASVA